MLVAGQLACPADPEWPALLPPFSGTARYGIWKEIFVADKIDEDENQAVLSRKALELTLEGSEEPKHPPTYDDPNEGMVSTPKADQAPSGAFDAEGQRPVLERSRKVR